MKKSITTIFLIVLSFLVAISSVNATTKDTELTNVIIQDKSTSASVDDIVLKDNNITSNITFNKVNDYVVFELVIKNNASEKYKIISIEDNNKNNYISTNYNYTEDYIKSGETASVLLRIKYNNELTDQEKISLNNLNIKINLEREDGAKQEIVVNPTTKDSILHYLVLVILSLLGIILVTVKKKNKLGIFVLVLATVLIPLSAIANEKYEVNLKFTNIDIIGKAKVIPEPEPETPDYSLLIDGSSFNEVINNEATGDFRKATEEEYNLVKDTLTDDNIVSTEESPKPVYTWDTSAGTLYYSDAGTTYMNPDSSNMFMNTQYETIDLSELDSSKVTNMSSMFDGNSSLNSLNLSAFETSNVTNMSNMFRNLSAIEELDLSTFNTSNVTNMSGMFGNLSAIEELDLSKFDTSNVTDMSNMFYSCTSLRTIYVLDEWDTSNVSDYEGMFEENTNLVGEKATYYDGEMNYAALDDYSDINYAHVDGGRDNPGYLTLKDHVKDFSILLHGYYGFDDKNFEIAEDATSFRKATEEEYNLVKDSLTEDNIVSEEYSPIPIYMWKDEDTVLYYSTASTIYLHYSIDSMFEATSYESIDLSGFDSSRVMWMGWMFRDAPNLKEIIFGDNFDTSNVEGMGGMFYSCEILEELDLSSFDTSNVKNMYEMFYESEMLNTIYVSDKWDISNVEESDNMFQNAYSIIGEKGTVYDSSKTDISYAHVDEGEDNPGYLTLKGHKKTQGPATLLNGNDFNWKLNSISSGTTTFRKATDEEYNSVKSSLSDDNVISEYGSPNVYMWASGNETLYYSKSDIIYLNEDSSYMFNNSPFETIDLSGLDTSRVTDMSSMFNSSSSLKNIVFGANNDTTNQNLSASISKTSKNNGINILIVIIPILFLIVSFVILIVYKKNNANKIKITIGVTVLIISILSIGLLFGGNNLKGLLASINSENSSDSEVSSNFDTSNVTDMSYMFENCTSLEELDLSSFNTSNVTDMSYMFNNCTSLEELDLSTFDTSNVTDMSYMFSYCTILRTIYVLDGWNTDNVTNFDSMFAGDSNLVGEKATAEKDGENYYAEYDGYWNRNYAQVDGGVDNPGFLTLKGHVKDFSILLEGYHGFDDKNSLIAADAIHFRKATEEEYNIVKNTLTEDNIVSEHFSPIPTYMWKVGDTALYYSNSSTIYMPYAADYMFASSSYETIDLSGLDSSRVKHMTVMFMDSYNLEEINFGSNFDTSKVRGMNGMFEGCSNIKELDLSTFDTSNVIIMREMFANNLLLETIYVSNKWDITNIEDSSYMFENTYQLVGEKGTEYNEDIVDSTYAHVDEGDTNPGYLILKGHERAYRPATLSSEWGIYYSSQGDTTFRKATEEEYNSVKTSLSDNNIISEYGSPNVYMWSSGDETLYYSRSDKIYLHENSSGMFAGCQFETIDLSGLDSSRVTNMSFMFYGCNNLETIYVSNLWNTSSVNDSDEMFYDCNSLVGGQGTIYNEEYFDGSYAHIDGGVDNPGYFTDIRNKQ